MLKRNPLKASLLSGGLSLALAFSAQAAVFQAEDYNVFNDTTPGNIGGAYRNENVDIQATQDVGGGFNVGWIETNEWLVYNNLHIPTTGSYTIKMRVASQSGATASVDLNGGAVLLGDMVIPSTGGWQSWTTVTKTVNINAGTYNLGVFAKTAGWNFNWIEVVSNGGGTGSIATLYQHCNYGGWSAGFNEAASFDMNAIIARGGLNDDASSLRLAPGYEAVIYENANFTGATVVVQGDTSCLSNFNDRASSIVIRKIATNNPVWADEFNTIDLNNWSFETGGGGFGNNEREYYTNGQNSFIHYDASAGSNVMVIEARRDNPANYGCWYGRCEYTSSRMVSSNKKTFKYGRIEARMKLPQTQGIWPAFWMLGSNIGQVGWPASGEIDIMEHVGFEPSITHGAIHGPGYSGNTPFMGTNYLNQSVDAGFHVYAVEWNTNGISWFVDGNKFYSVTRAQVQTYGNWVYDQPFFLLLNVAVGGTWPGNPDGSSSFPQRMSVDYIRVYQ